MVAPRFAFSFPSRNLLSYCAHLAWLLFSLRALSCLAKQTAGDGSQIFCGGGQLLVNFDSDRYTLVKQLGGKYE